MIIGLQNEINQKIDFITANFQEVLFMDYPAGDDKKAH